MIEGTHIGPQEVQSESIRNIQGEVSYMRRSGSLLAALSMLLVSIPALVNASVPKVIVIEEFGATWCTYCPGARCGLETVQEEFGYDKIVHFEDHCSSTDPFRTNETTARENYYHVPGYPTVWFDGLSSVVGSSGCTSSVSDYRNAINQRLNQTGGVSPISISGHMETGGGNATVTAKIRLVDPVQLANLRATILLYEDGIYWCCGYGGQSIWDKTTRKIYDQNIVLTNVGDEVVVSLTQPLSTWNPAELKAVVYVQNTVTKEIIQGLMVRDYTIDFTSHTGSAPDGNGTVVFHGVLRNLQESSQDYTLQIATSFGNWPADFLICGDSNPHSDPTLVTLPAGGTCNIDVRVHTDAAHEVRNGVFQVVCNNSGRSEGNTFRVFNGSPAILLVDNDGSNSYETGIVNGLNANSYLFDDWDVANDHANATPNLAQQSGYDIIIWHTANRQSNVLVDGDQANLQSFMDAGGALFLTSQYYLNSLGGGTNPFTQDYLGVASYTIDKAYLQMNGVAGDVIGDGITLPLHFQYPSFARGDDAVPGANSATDFLAPDGSHAMIRTTMPSGSRSVFMPERFDAISESDPNPNNAATVIHRIIEWLRPAGTADVDPNGASLVSGIQQARPNPFRRGTDISFALSQAAASAPVRLEIIDIGGRIVAKVVDGAMTPGIHVAGWNGQTSGGAKAQSGVYFARLTTREGVRSTKLILTK